MAAIIIWPRLVPSKKRWHGGKRREGEALIFHFCTSL